MACLHKTARALISQLNKAENFFTQKLYINSQRRPSPILCKKHFLFGHHRHFVIQIKNFQDF